MGVGFPGMLGPRLDGVSSFFCSEEMHFLLRKCIFSDFLIFLILGHIGRHRAVYREFIGNYIGIYKEL